jgi:hypothetical protein
MVELSNQKQSRPDLDLLGEALAQALQGQNVVFVPLDTTGGDVSLPCTARLEMRGPPSPEYKIPRRLIFTYQNNLIETKDPPLLYGNVETTIQTYRAAWGDPEAPVWFLNDTDCRSAVYAAKPNLLPAFRSRGARIVESRHLSHCGALFDRRLLF